MKRRHFLFAVAATAVLPALAWADTVDPALARAATAYLHLCDSGDFGTAWDQSADVVKTAVQRGPFVASMKQARTPLGAVVKRTLSDTKKTNLPGAGNSVIFTYDTAFKARAGVQEVLVFSQGSDGQWKASGYHLH
jgi:serine/threonine-protein kinase